MQYTEKEKLNGRTLEDAEEVTWLVTLGNAHLHGPPSQLVV